MDDIAAKMVVPIENKVWLQVIQNPQSRIWCEHRLLNNCIVTIKEMMKI